MVEINKNPGSKFHRYAKNIMQTMRYSFKRFGTDPELYLREINTKVLDGFTTTNVMEWLLNSKEVQEEFVKFVESGKKRTGARIFSDDYMKREKFSPESIYVQFPTRKVYLYKKENNLLSSIEEKDDFKVGTEYITEDGKEYYCIVADLAQFSDKKFSENKDITSRVLIVASSIDGGDAKVVAAKRSKDKDLRYNFSLKYKEESLTMREFIDAIIDGKTFFDVKRKMKLTRRYLMTMHGTPLDSMVSEDGRIHGLTIMDE